MSDSMGLQEQLRAYGVGVEAQRRPVDVDAILAGMVAAPPRRTVTHRHVWLVTVAAALVLIMGIAGVVVRRNEDPVQVITPATSGPVPTSVATSRPVPTPPSVPFDASGADFVHDAPDGFASVAVTFVPALDPPIPCEGLFPNLCNGPWIDLVFGIRGSRVGQGRYPRQPNEVAVPLRDAGGASGDDLSVNIWQTRKDLVVRVTAEVRVGGGQVVVDEMVPQDGIVVFVSRGLGFGVVRAFDANGTEVASLASGFLPRR